MKISRFNLKNFTVMLAGGLFFLVMLYLLSGCATQKRCNSKFPPVIETHTEHTEKTIIRDTFLPGATVREMVPYRHDSVIYKERWITVTDESGLAELRYRLDSLGGVKEMECTATGQIIQKFDRFINEYSKKEEKTVVKEVHKVTPWYNYLIGFLLLLIIFRKPIGKLLTIIRI